MQKSMFFKVEYDEEEKRCSKYPLSDTNICLHCIHRRDLSVNMKKVSTLISVLSLGASGTYLRICVRIRDLMCIPALWLKR